MICLICNKDFNSVSSHIRVHSITAREYKMEFDIPLLSPLMEEWLHKDWSEASKKRRPKEELERMRKLSFKKCKGAKFGKRDIPACSLRKVRDAIKEKLPKTCRAKFFKESAELIEDHKNGASISELSSKYRVGANTIRKYLGESLDKGMKTKRRKYDTEIRVSVLKDYAQSVSPIDISANRDIPIATIWYWVANSRISNTLNNKPR